MTQMIEIAETDENAAPVLRAKMCMLAQMAEALEDEAAGLYRRAAGYEEEEFLLEREIEARQTEINRLALKLNGLRADRDALLEKIDSLTGEAVALREEVYSKEEARALDAIARAAVSPMPPCSGDIEATGDGELPRSVYFRRAQLADMAS